MGMYDDVKCKYPLPDTPVGMDMNFQTKDFGDGFTGGFMDNYTITEDGELIFHKEAWELVPEEERPYWGKPEWDKNPLLQLAGSMKTIPLGDEVMDYHGTLNIYTMIGKTWYEYEFKFTDGKVADVKRINKEFG
jgi:hypothetical protein